MGYELYITRAEEWFESDEHPVPLDEWLAFARADPRLQLVGDGTEPMLAFIYQLASGDEVSLYWHAGNVHIKGCRDTAHALELVPIATDLKANLIGDEGERYTVDGVRPA